MQEANAVRLLQRSTTFIGACMGIWVLINPLLPETSNFKLWTEFPVNVGVSLLCLLGSIATWYSLEQYRLRAIEEERAAKADEEQAWADDEPYKNLKRVRRQ